MANKRTRKAGYSKKDWKAELKKLHGIDAVLERLEQDHRLPTFPEFFLACLIMGNGECINIKAMFPELYKNLASELKHIGTTIREADLRR